MNTLPIRFVTLILLLGFMSAAQYTFGKERTSPDAQNDDGREFRVLVPKFATESMPQLGYSVTFALVHEVFRTFSISIPFRDDGVFDQLDKCCLPKNTFAILDPSLSEQTHDVAYERALSEQAQLVLWGKAWPYGTDVVVQPFLTLAHPPQRLAQPPNPLAHPPVSMAHGIENADQDQWQWLLWQITAEVEGGSSATVSLTEFPSLQYEMSPIVFDSEKLKLFASFDGMPVYKDKSVNSKQVGTTRYKLTASQHDPGGWTRIGPPAGWIQLPDLDTADTVKYGWIQLPDLDAADTVEYVGGLVHFMRGNWKRARISFERVMQTREAPTQIRRDAALLLTASLYRLDEACTRCDEVMKFAENLNPYSLTTAKYYFMASLARARKSNDTAAWQDALARLDKIRPLAPEDDAFVKNAKEVLDILRNQAGASADSEF